MVMHSRINLLVNLKLPFVLLKKLKLVYIGDISKT